MSVDSSRRSSDAYQSVMNSGLIQMRAAQVYQMHYHLGSLTKREMFEHFKASFPDENVQVDSFGPRYAQLVKAGLMEEVGEKNCLITGQTVTVWDVTTKIPRTKLPKSVSEKQELKLRVGELEVEVKRLNEYIKRNIEEQPSLKL